MNRLFDEIRPLVILLVLVALLLYIADNIIYNLGVPSLLENIFQTIKMAMIMFPSGLIVLKIIKKGDE